MAIDGHFEVDDERLSLEPVVCVVVHEILHDLYFGLTGQRKTMRDHYSNGPSNEIFPKSWVLRKLKIFSLGNDPVRLFAA